MRRWKRCLCALICVLALVLPPSPSMAAEEVYFVSVNDNLRPLTADTMPTMVGGVLYVPYTVFDVNTTGVNLGVGCAEKSMQNMLVLYSLKGALTFDLSAGTCYDQRGNYYAAKAITRHGKTYLPLFFVCEFLGLNCSYLNTPYAPMLRIKNGNEYLSDKTFLEAVSLQSRYDPYIASITPQTPQATPPATSAAPPVPPARAGVPVFLAFRCGEGDALPAILDALDGTELRALFLFEPEALGDASRMVRRIVGSDHAIGFLADAEDPDAADRLEEGNRFLFTIARAETRFVALNGASSAQREAMEELGWICWEANLDGAADPDSMSAYAVISRLSRAEETVRLVLSDGGVSAAALPGILNHLRSDAYLMRSVSETAG